MKNKLPSKTRRETGGVTLEERLKQFYNTNKFYFSSLQGHNADYYRNIYAVLDKFKLDIKGRNVVDIGSGTGQLLNILKEKYGGYSATGTDISEIGLKMHTYGKAVKADARSLPFKDNEFDFLFCTDVLEHIPNYGKVIDEAYRVTKKHGYILVRTQNYDCPFLPFPKTPDLTIRETVVADKDAVSRTSAREIINKFRNLTGDILLFESWASFGWKIPILKIFNALPILRFYGGTCTVLFQKK